MIFGLLCCLGVSLDAFQTIILPRRPTGRLRITRLFYIATWQPWAALARLVKDRKVREQFYSIFGPPRRPCCGATTSMAVTMR